MKKKPGFSQNTGKALVEKRNVLNEVKRMYMTLQEQQFFCVYLSRINARDSSTRKVRLSVAEFQNLIGIQHANIQQMQATTNRLLSKIVNIPNEAGGYDAFQLFSHICVANDNDGWYIEFDANDKAVPLLFNFKREFVTYKVENVLRLTSVNQMRMYEILKQYEKIGTREIAVDELRELLGLKKSEYPRWGNFKTAVLDNCMEMLLERTDIKYTYERGRTGTGGKWISIIFHIEKNPEGEQYSARFAPIRMLIDAESVPVQNTEHAPTPYAEAIEALHEYTDHEFTDEEAHVLFKVLYDAVPGGPIGMSMERADYLIEKHNLMKAKASRIEITSRFAYLKKLLESGSN